MRVDVAYCQKIIKEVDDPMTKEPVIKDPMNSSHNYNGHTMCAHNELMTIHDFMIESIPY